VKPHFLYSEADALITLVENDFFIDDFSDRYAISKEQIASFYRYFKAMQAEGAWSPEMHIELTYTFNFPESIFWPLLSDQGWLGFFANSLASNLCISIFDLGPFAKAKTAAKAVKMVAKKVLKRAAKDTIKDAKEQAKIEATKTAEEFYREVLQSRRLSAAPGGRRSKDVISNLHKDYARDFMPDAAQEIIDATADVLDQTEVCLIEMIGDRPAQYQATFSVYWAQVREVSAASCQSHIIGVLLLLLAFSW